VSHSRAGIGLIALLALGLWAPGSAFAHAAKGDGRLSRIGPAPEFALATAEGGRLALDALRGKVVAVTFIYATCTDTCPLLVSKLVGVQRRLGREGAERVRFLAVTVDPERDTPEVLRRYAEGQGAAAPAWAFLTGTADEIRDVVRRYGVYARRGPRGDVDHTFLTSVIDGEGVLRVQYLGVRFDPDEFYRDVRALLREGRRAGTGGGR
jgi:protein SCO1/2